ncbi:MAG: ribosome silencing factor [Gammaproteobacteria bacterium]
MSKSRSAEGRAPGRSSNRLQRLVQETLDDMKALDVVALDVRHLTTITDVMFVASGRSDRHVRAIAEAIVERSEQAGVRPLGVEGMDGGEWVLIDLSDVIVHVMIPRARDFYEIEKLWDISRLAQETES